MVAATMERETVPVVTGAAWVTVRCTRRDCREVLFRYQPPPDADARRYVRVEVVCPDRRCRKMQEIRLPAGAVPGLV